MESLSCSNWTVTLVRLLYRHLSHRLMRPLVVRPPISSHVAQLLFQRHLKLLEWLVIQYLDIVQDWCQMEFRYLL